MNGIQGRGLAEWLSRVFVAKNKILECEKLMRKFFRSKLFISLILLILAGVMVYGFLPKLYGSQDKTIEVVQLIDDINLGTRISENMLTTKTIGSYGLDASVIKSKDAIVGLYAATDLRRGSCLYSDQFAADFSDVEGAIDTVLKPGDKLVTVSLATGAKSVGGMARAGDFVDVLTEMPKATAYDEYGYAKEDDTIEMELKPILKHVQVYKLQNNELEDISELDRKWQAAVQKNDGSEDEIDASRIPAFVTLIVSDEQAIALANQEYSGTVHLVLYPNSTENSAEQAPTTPAVIPPSNEDAETEPTADGEGAEPQDGEPVQEPETTGKKVKN